MYHKAVLILKHLELHAEEVAVKLLPILGEVDFEAHVDAAIKEFRGEAYSHSPSSPIICRVNATIN
jgi:hypothetical protein